MKRKTAFMVSGAAFLFAIVLIVVLFVLVVVAAGLMNWLPSFGGPGVTAEESTEYWSGLASPFLITNASVRGGGITFSVKNKAVDPLEIQSITLDGKTTGISKTTLSKDERKEVKGTAPRYCTSGTVFSYDVVFSFNDTKSGVPGEQVGEKPLVGNCV